ncbi:hypothetical protein DL771_001167 [Monosporascus sp. 5C6A]|nr:hypothetical protein DL771_001167 [Monosporascus sp. 5C6A]
MATALRNAVIRNSSYAGLVGYFQTLLLTLDWKTIFDHLIESTSSGAIDKEALGVWVFVCQNADATVAAMAQNVSATGRHNAIKQFGRQLRTEAGFPAVRDAIGGVEGTLALMSQMSVNEVDHMCKTMRRSSTARAAVNLRQEYMSALYHALRGAPGAPRNPDTRPLGYLYKEITPACNAEIALRGVDFLHCTPGELRYQAHTAAYEAHALAAMFPTEGEGQPVSAFTHLMERSRSFNMLVFQRLLRDRMVLTREEGESVIRMAKRLLRKASLKNAKDDMTEQAMRLVVDCVRKHPVLADCIEITGRNDLVSSAIKLWRSAQQPDTMARLEESLVALVALIPGYKLDKIGFIAGWVEPVQSRLRFRLMHLLLLHTRHFQVDIESQSPENDERLRQMEPWDSKPFFVLPAEQGLKLFEYMMKLQPDGSFLKGDRDTVLEELRINVFGPPKRDAEWYERTRNSIAELKRSAASTREWQDRANMASSALSLCIEMESLDLYTDVVLWARRFRRDTQLVQRFYSTAAFYSSATLDLLSGIPLKSSKQAPRELLVPIDEVRSNILKANKIMLLLLETASEALCEPSFRRRDWDSVLDLPQKTTQRRLDRAHEIQEIYNFDEETLFKNIWNPTIDLLIAFEKLGLKSGHEKLQLQQLSGPLGPLSAVLERPQPATYAFLNELAQKRDELWREFRLKDHPAVVSLGSQWPQGLPVQFLCPETDWDHVPYVQSRSEKVVFVDGSVALQPSPEDEELREAIGPFVDGYMFALQVYIKSSISDDDRDWRIRHAWEHAVTNLSDGAMSEEEVPRFWRSIFEHVLGRLKLPFPSGLAPVRASPSPELPRDTDEGPSEWNPEPDYKIRQEPSKELPQTCLSSMLSQDFNVDSWLHTKKSSIFSHSALRTIGYTRPHILNTIYHYPGYPPDYVVAAALAYTNTKYGSDTSFLLHSFPSRSDIRYPAFYLDQEFLDLVSKDTHWSRVVGMCRDAPIPILVRLAESLIARLLKDPSGGFEVRAAAMQIIQFISRSDRPAAACGLIQQVILDQPADSSWHRHLLNIGFLGRLPARDAREFFTGLSSQIQQRLAQWSRPREGQDRPETLGHSNRETSDRNYVKVTTVKMIAQMLHDATYIDQSSICDILAGLLTTVKQVDIQIAAIDSLISMLGTGSRKNEGVQALVLDAIEHHVVHRAAALDERQPMSSEDWRNAESNKELPKVYDDGSFSTYPPILDLLVKATGRWKEDTPLRHEWASRVLIPAAEQSAANNYRWTKMFIARHSLDINVDSLPRLPVRPALLLQLFTTELEFFTRANFETLQGYVRIHLQVPDNMRLAGELVTDKQRPDLKDSNEAKHWLAQWPLFGVFTKGLNQIIHQLKKPPRSIPSDSRPSPQELGAFVLEVAERILQQSRIEEFSSLIGAVRSRLNSKSTWITNCLPLLEEFIARIDTLRTDEWQRNPDRKPAKLPETLPIKASVLGQKHSPDTAEEPSDAALDAFAADVAKLVDEFIDTGIPYHEQWPGLKSSIMGTFESRHYVRAALALAAPVPVDQMRLSLAEMLILELADDMLRCASGRQDSKIAKQARTLLRGWVRSPIERLRSRGTATVHVLRENSKQEKIGAWFGIYGLDEEEL